MLEWYRNLTSPSAKALRLWCVPASTARPSRSEPAPQPRWLPASASEVRHCPSTSQACCLMRAPRAQTGAPGRLPRRRAAWYAHGAHRPAHLAAFRAAVLPGMHTAHRPAHLAAFRAGVLPGMHAARTDRRTWPPTTQVCCLVCTQRAQNGTLGRLRRRRAALHAARTDRHTCRLPRKRASCARRVLDLNSRVR
jgi:hypothetical protein